MSHEKAKEQPKIKKKATKTLKEKRAEKKLRKKEEVIPLSFIEKNWKRLKNLCQNMRYAYCFYSSSAQQF